MDVNEPRGLCQGNVNLSAFVMVSVHSGGQLKQPTGEIYNGPENANFS